MPRVKENKPRGRMSSYAYFVQVCREEHRKKHPEEAIVFAVFSKKCSDRWKVSAAAVFFTRVCSRSPICAAVWAGSFCP